MTKHTLGPWDVLYRSRDDWDVFARPVQRILACELNEADARLIAAAPELLEALEVVAFQWAGHAEKCSINATGSCNCDWPKIRHQCNAAIAKARGQS